jgi:protein FAM32A
LDITYLLHRKKKSKSKAKPDDEIERERNRVKELLLKEDDTSKTGSPSGSGRSSPAIGGSNGKKTDAERRFEEVQKRRVRELAMIDSYNKADRMFSSLRKG